MRRSRPKVLVGLGVATIMLEWLSEPNIFIGGSLLVTAAFLVWWGLAPASVESCISRLPPPTRGPIRRTLEWVSELIEGNDDLLNKRRRYFRNKFETLDGKDIDYLKHMLVSGNAHNPPGDTWTRLKEIGFVWSDYSGPKGIKPELIQLVGDLLNEHETALGEID